MNKADAQYKELLTKILAEGRQKKSRAGDTVDLFGGQMRFNLSEGFPLSTLRKVPHKAVFKELFWFLSGSTNVSVLTRQGVHIWDADAYRNYCAKCSGNGGEWDKWMHKNEDGYLRMYLFEEFVKKLETDDEFAEKWGDLGKGGYGWAWRKFPVKEVKTEELNHAEIGDCFVPNEDLTGWIQFVDQIQNIVDKLKNDPDSRRIILNAWHPYWAEKAILPPCHLFSQFGTELLTLEERATIYYGKPSVMMRGLTVFKTHSGDWKVDEDAGLNYEASVSWLGPEDDEKLMQFFDSLNVPKRRLNCHLLCRSQDFLLGTAFNVPMYALLTELLAYCTGMVAGDLVWSASSIHVYSNQKEQAKELLAREPLKLPQLKIKEGAPKNIFELGMEHVEVIDYAPHHAIKIPLSVG
jgi:thymidylate synthase